MTKEKKYRNTIYKVTINTCIAREENYNVNVELHYIGYELADLNVTPSPPPPPPNCRRLVYIGYNPTEQHDILTIHIH